MLSRDLCTASALTAARSRTRTSPATRPATGLTDITVRRLANPAFIEGWALYAERLGLVRFYEDPYSDFGRTYENWRACRLVVDTRMHYFGWTLSKPSTSWPATTALRTITLKPRLIATSWPGQALAYKTGELRFGTASEGRERARRRVRHPRGSTRSYWVAGRFLLDVLDANVNEFITSKQPEGALTLNEQEPAYKK
ncbi:MAG: DUF885 family protein [Planctomycetaceae bacterium]|nr:DUF885 family protein [Planctomycetaceae bacterium]